MMRKNWLKDTIRSLFFRGGAIRTILFGPMRGMVFRVGPVTGLSPWYSGVERVHQRIFKNLVRSGDVVLDIGANWGLHTLYLSRLVGPKGSVVAIEPLDLCHEELKWHVDKNNCNNVKTIQVAVSDSEGEEFFVRGDSAQTGSLSCIYPGVAQGNTLIVRTQTLDSIVQQLALRALRLVKIDVEGAETKVLLGSQKTIKQFEPYFIVELHTPEQDVRAAQFLTSKGYQLQRVGGPPILRTDRG